MGCASAVADFVWSGGPTVITGQSYTITVTYPGAVAMQMSKNGASVAGGGGNTIVYTATDTALGTLDFIATAVSPSGPSTTSPTYSVLVIPPPDTTAPSVPGGLSVSNPGTTSITLAWSPSSDNQGVAGYEIALDNVIVALSGTTSVVIDNLMLYTYFTVTVRAYDQAGNRSGWSSAYSFVTADWPAAAAAPLVGVTSGDFSVDNKGSGNYSVPLRLAPGRSGLQPSVSLAYSSGGGNGPLGVGFSLSTGFPQAITRGRSILARDQETRGIEFSANDKFYLDGKRLLCVSGTYGQPGSTYRTEVDSFVTVTTAGSGANIETFTVTDKSGSKMIFGKYSGSTDAYQQGGGEAAGLAYTYALKRVEDTIGNYCELDYDASRAATGEYLLSAIRYTGGTGIAATSAVNFFYGSRPDETDSYTANRLFKHTGRLDRVEATTTNAAGQATVVSRYDLTYDRAAGQGRSRLISLQPYFGVGGALLAATASSFYWSKGTLQASIPQWALAGNVDAGNTYHNNSYATGDFDGDGRTEQAGISLGIGAPGLYVGLANGSTFTAMPAAALVLPSMDKGVGSLCALDINGDGRTDLLITDATCKNIYAVLSTGSGFTGLNGEASPTWIASTDVFLKDPRPDTGTSYVMRDRDTGAASSRIVTGDFTGDGRDDFLIHGYDGYFYRFKSTGAGFGAAEKLSQTIAGQVQPIASACAVAPGFFTGIFFPAEIVRNYAITPMPCDLNGDGITDYAWIERLPSESIIAGITTFSCRRQLFGVVFQADGTVSQPFGIGPPQIASSSSNGLDMTREDCLFGLFPGDYNGDGLRDFLFCTSGRVHDDNHWMLLLNRGPGADLCPQWESTWGAIPNSITVAGATIPTSYIPVTAAAWTGLNLNRPLSRTAGESIALVFMSMSTASGTGMTAADLNGDGLSDLIWYAYDCEASARGWYVIYSDGKGGFANPSRLPTFGTLWGAITPSPAGGTSVPTDFVDYAISEMGDVDGDGLPEFSSRFTDCGRSIDGASRVSRSVGTFADLLIGTRNGVNTRTEIRYIAGKNSAVYTRGPAVTYPIRELPSSAPVVSDVLKDAGGNFGAFGAPVTDASGNLLRSVARFSYQYSGLRLDVSGRGDLGFHSFITLDRQTNLFKYQFLAQSFPMTGLTAREQTYRYWDDGANVSFRLINSHDNTVVFDEVDNGSSTASARYATVYPFISKAVESRWEDGPDRHFPVTGGGEWAKVGSPESKPELLFSKALPLGAHITVSAASVFDEQTTAQSTIPGGKFSASDRAADWSLAGTNTVSGSVSYVIPTLGLPRKITYGNLKSLSTDYGDGFTETVETTYKTPVGTLTGLVDTVKTTVVSAIGGTEVAPVKSYTYWGSTPLVATETVDAAAAGVSNPNSKLSFTTTYVRDNDTRGRVTETKLTGYIDSTAPDTSSTLTLSKVTRFNDRFDLPEVVEDAYGHATTTDYHPSLGIPKSVTEVNGATGETDFDALGRATQTRDLNLALQTDTAFAWTSATANDWTQTQSVAVPGGVAGVGLSSVYAVRTTATSRAVAGVSLRQPVTAYFDRLGRTIRTVKEGFAGQKAVTDTVFNVLGQAVAVSLPYNPTDSATGPFWAKTTYDVLGRVQKMVAPNGTETTTTYAGRATQVTVDAPLLGGVNPVAQINTTLVDAKGRTIKVWNADNVPAALDAKTGSSTEASVEYKLDGFGRMRATVLRGNSAGTAITVSAKYDTLGRQTELSDPDKGLWKYTNNALGQVLQQEDAKHNITVSTFDPLGRPLSRTTTEPAGGPQETANWYYYDTAAVIAARPAMHLAPLGTQGWIGALHCEESSVTGAPGYPAKPTSTLHYFDGHGRPSINLTTIDEKWFYTNTDYDAAGRVGSVRHFWRPPLHEAPGDQPYVWQDFGYSYTYTAASYLLEMRDSTGQVWWEADSSTGYDHLDRPVLVRKGHGHWTQRTYRPEDGVLASIKTGPTAGSGAVQDLSVYFDGLGNLVSRADGVRSLSESFEYDSLNRLTKRNGAAIVAYAINGNVTSKLDVNGATSGTYAYTGTQPHAVTSAFGYAMSYDDNGNLITRTNGAGSESWATRWAGFDKPRWLAKTAYGATTGSEFIYNANRSRVVQMEFDSVNGTGVAATPGHYTRKRLYAWGATGEIDYKNLAGSGATPNWQLDTIRLYVPGPEGVIGAMEFAPNGPVEKTKRPLVYHYDYLGSVDTVTVLADRTTHVALDDTGKQSRHSFDPWGQRRDPDDWSGQPVNTTVGGHADVTPRGFAGHEMMDSLGLVNMNGRIYDGLLGRFLSADTLVQSPGSLQSYNRYSYVLNNPLTSVDKNGFQACPPGVAPLAGIGGPGGEWVLNPMVGEAMAAAQTQGLDPQKVITAGADSEFKRQTDQEAKDLITGYSIIVSFTGAGALSSPAGGLAGLATNAVVDAGVFGTTAYGRTVAHNAIDGKPLTQGAVGAAVKEGSWAALGGMVTRGIAKLLGRVEVAAPKTGSTPAVDAAPPTANPRNLISRQGPEEMSGNKVKRYTKDMKENGFDPNHPIEVAEVDGKKIIIDGHHRTEAAKRAGIDEVPIKTTTVSEEEAAKLAREAAEAAEARMRRQR